MNTRYEWRVTVEFEDGTTRVIPRYETNWKAGRVSEYFFKKYAATVKRVEVDNTLRA